MNRILDINTAKIKIKQNFIGRVEQFHNELHNESTIRQYLCSQIIYMVPRIKSSMCIKKDLKRLPKEDKSQVFVLSIYCWWELQYFAALDKSYFFWHVWHPHFLTSTKISSILTQLNNSYTLNTGEKLQLPWKSWVVGFVPEKLTTGFIYNLCFSPLCPYVLTERDKTKRTC